MFSYFNLFTADRLSNMTVESLSTGSSSSASEVESDDEPLPSSKTGIGSSLRAAVARKAANAAEMLGIERLGIELAEDMKKAEDFLAGNKRGERSNDLIEGKTQKQGKSRGNARKK